MWVFLKGAAMKKTVYYVIVTLIVTLIVAVLPVHGEEGVYDGVIRLHVLAPSDSTQDQALKLSVRDEILAVYGSKLADAGDIFAAEGEVIALCHEIEATAAAVVKREGYAYTVKVEYGDEAYPKREYGEYTFPAGVYRSLRIVIGEGAGQNWWCVLFPPLCLDIATDSVPNDDALAVGLSPGAQTIVKGDEGEIGYRVRFKVLELLEGALRNRKR
jgi:stage II sporulation protein R